ncbi:hypothetical protein QFC20_004571 [Naganishia adeliensis]|uniref:Uncharacterized protein n=1 Tax=Naganishia adeliensis TaxID=92952 RepID=A0ACC2VXT9_9TREE|nr:hypothetical protein QFC20_004571 [Naganishia adeliensis]
MSVSSATTLAHKHTHHTHHARGAGRRKSGIHRTSSHVGVHSTASTLALTTTTEAPRLEREDSGASKASDDVSITSAPARLNKGKHARPAVGGRRKNQVHLVDHSVEPEPTNEEEEEEWEEAPVVPDEGASEDDDDDDDDGDELVIRTKGRKKTTKEVPRVGFRPPHEPQDSTASNAQPPSPVPVTPAPSKPALPTQTERPPSPVPSESGTLIATPTRPTARHVRTRNSHTSLRSLAAGSLRSLFAGPHHPLSSPTAAGSGSTASGRREAVAPPVVSGEIARGAWAFSSGEKEIQSLPPSPTTSNARLPGRPNAAGSLRKASFTGPTPDSSGLPQRTGRLSAHSVAAKAAQLPTVGSRLATSGTADARHQQERESVNLVSRFVTLPSTTSTPGDTKQPVFPDSPFAGAHASLVRTLMEEGARLLPIDQNTSTIAPTTRRTDATRAIPRPQRTTSTFPSAFPSAGSSSSTPIPYGAAPAPPGQEWVLGLTPFEMSVQRCLEQRKGAVRLATGTGVGAFGGVAGLNEAELYMRCMKNQ